MSSSSPESRRDDAPASAAQLGCGSWIVLALVVVVAVKAAISGLEHDAASLRREVQSIRADLRAVHEKLADVSDTLRALREEAEGRPRAAEAIPPADPEKK